ncbi:MAG: AEC family transporter [Candidatus Anstonellaceae archaeon]
MLEAVAFVFGLIAIGYVAGYFKLVSPKAYQTLNDYVYFVAMPALIFARLASAQLGSQHLQILIANALPIAIVLAAVAAAWKLKLLSQKQASLLVATSFFGNIVYMGFPIVEIKFGPDALQTAAIISFAYNVMMFIPGLVLILLITKKGSEGLFEEKVLKNTVILSCAFGAGASILNVDLAPLMLSVIEAAGATTAPVALFSLGLFFKANKIAFVPAAFGISAVKLIGFPLLFMATSFLIGFEGEPYNISLLEAMMPVAVTNFVLASKLELDENLAASSVFVSTLFSAFTLSLI